MEQFDVLIIGGGPGGSMAASLLAKNNCRVALFEKEPYPRFHIGESLLPASMPLLKEIGFYEHLDSGKYLRKYGARFVDYETDEEFYFGFGGGMNESIPMAFEVPRAEFDRDLLEHAKKLGAVVKQPETVQIIDLTDNNVTVKTDKGTYQARYLLDTTGRDSFLGKKFNIRQVNKGLNNIGVFTHFKNVKRYSGINEGDITIGLLPNGAWTWIIPFQGDVTSVGVVSSSEYFDGHGDFMGYLQRKVEGSPTVQHLMKDATAIMPPQAIANYSHTCDRFYGERWLLAGDAALFLDPIFSSGVHMSLSSSKKAAETIFTAIQTNSLLDENNLGREYEQHVRKGATRFRNLIQMFYDGRFVAKMGKTKERPQVMRGFISAVAGDVWNESNFLFQVGVL